MANTIEEMPVLQYNQVNFGAKLRELDGETEKVTMDNHPFKPQINKRIFIIVNAFMVLFTLTQAVRVVPVSLLPKYLIAVNICSVFVLVWIALELSEANYK